VIKNYVTRMKAKSQPPSRKPLSKILWSGFGAFLGIYLVAIFGYYFSIEDNFFLLGSFGASAVLIYGAPQADFSQPRNIIGGHVLSALVAVLLLKVFSSFFSTELLCAQRRSFMLWAMNIYTLWVGCIHLPLLGQVRSLCYSSHFWSIISLKTLKGTIQPIGGKNRYM